jgi:UDP-N-acetylglucosamine diphosphorylase/glucosamine-1-phosphate N-acetyltransferase
MKIILFEDTGFKNLLPLVYFRPIWELRCGAFTLCEKIRIQLKDHSFYYLARDHLQKYYLDEQLVFDLIPTEETLFINGRWLAKGDQLQECLNLAEGFCLTNTTEVLAFKAAKKNLKNYFTEGILLSDRVQNDFTPISISTNLIKFPWDLIYANGDEIVSDISLLKMRHHFDGRIDQNVNFLGKEDIYLSAGSRLMPGVTINAENGPVWIDQNATVMPHAVLEGPLYLGKNSTIKTGAKIWENTTIGPMCKVGGDVEESVILAYSNKQHEGFLGHAYLAEWINIGADTNNSDLKNNYGEITVFLNGFPVNTGKQFLGLIMGDHSKTAINTMLNTGTVVGVNCNVFGSGFPPKFIPSYSWGGEVELREYQFEKAIETARSAMKRRQRDFTEKDLRLFEETKKMAKDIENRMRMK